MRWGEGGIGLKSVFVCERERLSEMGGGGYSTQECVRERERERERERKREKSEMEGGGEQAHVRVRERLKTIAKIGNQPLVLHYFS